MKALIIDDNPDDLLITSIYMEDKGFKCITANGIEKALELYTTEKYDVIITDTDLKIFYQGMNNGIQLMQKIRQLYPENKTPIIVMSGIKEHEKEALNAGAIAFWNKEFIKENIEHLNDLLNIK